MRKLSLSIVNMMIFIIFSSYHRYITFIYLIRNTIAKCVYVENYVYLHNAFIMYNYSYYIIISQTEKLSLFIKKRLHEKESSMNIALLFSSDELKVNLIKQFKNLYGNNTIYDLSFSCIDNLFDLIGKIHINFIIMDYLYKVRSASIINTKIKTLSPDTQILWVSDKNFKSLFFKSSKSNENYSDFNFQKNDYNNISPQILFFAYKNSRYKICEKDIFYFEMQNKNLYIRLSDRKINVGRVTLKTIKSKINSTVFCYCNQSFIININKVNTVENNSHGQIITFSSINDHVYVTSKYKSKIIKSFTKTDNIIRISS